MKIYFTFVAIFLSLTVALPAGAVSIDPSAVGKTDLNYRKSSTGYVLVLKPGQKVMESLRTFMEKEQLVGASFTGIGAVKNVEVAYYNTDKKKYQNKEFPGEAEIISLIGNLGSLDKKPIVHAHIVLAGSDYKAFGGHLIDAEISITSEIFIIPTTVPIERELNSEFPGAKTINFDSK